MEEECFAPCEKFSTTLETNLLAREVRSSGLLEAPEVPGDGPDGQIFGFPNFTQMAVFEPEMAFGEPWGYFPGRPGSSRAILGNFIF